MYVGDSEAAAEFDAFISVLRWGRACCVTAREPHVQTEIDMIHYYLTELELLAT